MDEGVKVERVKISKNHICIVCKREILAGSEATRTYGEIEGMKVDIYTCDECKKRIEDYGKKVEERKSKN